MKRSLLLCGCILAASGWFGSELWGRGRGGGGGGARGGGGAARAGGGGFSGGARPSGGFSGGMPSARPSGGAQFGGGLSGGGYRPSQPQRPSGGGQFGGAGPSTRPGGIGGATSRPGGAGGLVHMPGSSGAGNLGIGGRPQLGEGGAITRPDFAGGAGPRPGNQLPGASTRPGASTLPGGGAARPGTGAVAGGGVRPGAGTANLPGLGASTRPGTGAIANRPGGATNAGAGNRFSKESVPQRHQDLSNQFSELQNNWGDGDWHSWTGPNGGQINHIGFWGPNGYWGHTGVWGPGGGHVGHTTGIGKYGAYGRTTGFGPSGYWSRSWGGWYNGYGPGWGNGRWDYLWNEYPVAMAFGCTMWGLNAVAYGMGVSDYSNPYYDEGSYPVSYDEPITGDPAYETPEAETADAATDPLTQTFDQARAAFQQDQFEQALQLTDEALKQAPRDAALNEFRSLCLFALGRYRESAAAIHAVLAAGPGWDWTTMISLYSSQDAYTAQLRKLEAAAQTDPRSADMRFLLAYHYLTADHADAAVEMWKQVVQIQPSDKLSADLLAMYGPKSDVAPTTPSAAPPDLDKPAYSAEQLAGAWKAAAGGGEFSLGLAADNTFTWTFTRDGMPQTVTGAYALGGNNLVMQPDTGGTMLSTITLENADTLLFAPIGDAEKLTFTK